MSRVSAKTAQPQEYFQWLTDLVQINEPDHSYFLLAKTLHDYVFSAKVPMDENRAEDGLKLRQIFQDENMCVLDLYSPCTILELLIGLSFRIDSQMYGEVTESVSQWFWIMIFNLGLEEFDDEKYYENGGTKAVEEILNAFVNREFDRYGKGGLFPLSKTKEDQRKVQIWYQMQAYLDENYPI